MVQFPGEPGERNLLSPKKAGVRPSPGAAILEGGGPLKSRLRAAAYTACCARGRAHSGRDWRYGAYMAVRAFWKVALGGGNFFSASS